MSNLTLFVVLIIGIIMSQTSASPLPTWNTRSGSAPVLIGHRGDSFLIPEHTTQSITVSAQEGADVVEADVRLTRDLQLVCAHDRDLASVTDIASRPEFADRAVIDSNGERKWMVEDFTLSEVQTLRAVQRRMNRRTTVFDGLLTILSFEEVMDLVLKLEEEAGRPLGLLADVKSTSESAVYADFALEKKLMDVADSKGFLSNTKRHFVLLSFDPRTLQFFRQRDPNVKLAFVSRGYGPISQLLPITEDGLKQLKALGIDIIGLDKNALLAENGSLKIDATMNDDAAKLGGFVPFKERVARIHASGFAAAAYTFSDSGNVLDRASRFKSRQDELEFFFDLGLDAFVVEHVSEAVSSRALYAQSRGLSIVAPSSACEGVLCSMERAGTGLAPKTVLEVDKTLVLD